ncbi:MAG: hypothetical protein J0H15_04280, partial [Xanthomonadales bacterium]|nr:hypothetical protein [Xanthomonadales bacterium]
STIVFGDTTTNRMASTAFSNIYRVLDTALTNTDRPLMAVVANIGTTLPACTYWVDWQLSGTLASGPWAPPVTLVGQTGKPGANAVQNDGSSWIPAMDDGSGAQQDFPFLIEGTAGGGGTTACSTTADMPWLSLSATSGSTAAGVTTPVTVTFNSTGLAAGTYTGNLCVASNDTAHAMTVVPVSMAVTPAGTTPTIAVTPASVSGTAAAGASTTVPLTIANTGAGTLTWNITEAAARGPYTPSGVAERQSPRVTAPRAPFVRDWAAAPLAEAIQDGGFELGDPNPFWDTDSLNFGTVLCDSSCSNSPENAPHSGSWWAWFGGIDSFETGMVSQQVTIPSGGATLKFWVRVPFSSGLAADFLKASVDGTEVWRVTADAAGAYQAAYQQVTVDVSAFADGGTHTVRFDSTVVGGGSETSNFMLDDVSLETGTGGGSCTAVSDVPWLSATPASGSTTGGSSTAVSVGLNAAGLTAGTYTANLCVNSNDAANPVVTVPVSFTVTGSGTGDPIAEVTPASFDFTVDAGDTGTDTMVIANIGGGTLTYAITEAEFDRNPPSYKTAAARKATDVDGAVIGNLSSARSLGASRFGEPVQLLATDISQMTDNTPGDEGVSCGQQATSTADNSWWRRFYFNEHANVGASANVTSVKVSTGSIAVPGGVPSTINLYTIPHSVTVNTIPTGQLTLIGTANFTATGSLQTITVPVTGAIDDTVGKDLVVEWHTDGNESGGQFFPGANASAESHPTFLSSSTCGISTPTPASAIDFPDFHLTMVVTLDDGGSEPQACDSPSNIPWLSATPASGSVAAGMSSDVAVSVDASALTPGSYSANLCVATNDPIAPMIPVPVTLTVEAGSDDGIFCSGFEEGENGSCGEGEPPVDENVVVSGPINVTIPETIDGLYINFVTGQTSPTEIPGYDFDPYKGSSKLLFYWAGDVIPGANGGVAATETGPFLVLGSGAVIGPSSTFSASANGANNETSAFLAGVEGYLGVKFLNEATGETNYGYVHIRTTAGSGFPATILDYAYDKSGAAITIP